MQKRKDVSLVMKGMIGGEGIKRVGILGKQYIKLEVKYNFGINFKLGHILIPMDFPGLENLRKDYESELLGMLNEAKKKNDNDACRKLKDELLRMRKDPKGISLKDKKIIVKIGDNLF